MLMLIVTPMSYEYLINDYKTPSQLHLISAEVLYEYPILAADSSLYLLTLMREFG